MKIYEKIVIDIASGEVIEEKSYEYSGPIAEAKGTKVKVPGPTPEERSLQRQQLEILRQQRAEQEMLRPFILSQMGLTMEDGRIRRLTEQERLARMTTPERLAYENMLKQMERNRLALEGKLPLSVGTIQRKEEEFRQLMERLDRAGATGTVRERALDLFHRRWAAIEDAERRGELNAGTAAALQRLGVATDIGNRRYLQLQNFGLPSLRLFGSYMSALQPYQYQRGLQLQAGMQTAANRAGIISSAMQGLGLAGGYYLGLKYGGI